MKTFPRTRKLKSDESSAHEAGAKNVEEIRKIGKCCGKGFGKNIYRYPSDEFGVIFLKYLGDEG